MTHYTVTTPKFMVYRQDEPPEECWDWMSVEADSPRAAKVAAVAKWDAMGPRGFRNEWVRMQRGDGRSPFRGLIVETPLCRHGACWCDICADDPNWRECPDCMAEYQDVGE